MNKHAFSASNDQIASRCARTLTPCDAVQTCYTAFFFLFFFTISSQLAQTRTQQIIALDDEDDEILARARYDKVR